MEQWSEELAAQEATHSASERESWIREYGERSWLNLLEDEILERRPRSH